MLARCLAAVGGALEEHAVAASRAGHREAEFVDELRVVGELAVGEGQGIEGEEVLLGHEHAGDPEGGKAGGEQAREAEGVEFPSDADREDHGVLCRRQFGPAHQIVGGDVGGEQA